MPAERRLLTIGHSYVVAMNRRLADAIARCGGPRWQVTAIAPPHFRGDLRQIARESIDDEACDVRDVAIAFDRSPHLMWYRALAEAMAGLWDVVHCWEEPYVLAGAQIACRTPAGTRFVVATFQNIAKSYPWPLSRFERTTMERADGWIAFGRTVHDTLASRPGYGSPSRTIPPGVDLDRYTPSPGHAAATRTSLGWDARDFVVGYLGRFVENKGLRVLTAALDTLPGPWRALFVGGGPMEHDLRAFAARHPGRVHVRTGIAHGDVPPWLNAMSVLCAPSLTTPRWREQFGRMLIEAMAAGTPVIASDSGEMPHVVGDAGVIVREGDATALSSALASLRDDGEQRRTLSCAGRQRASERFAWPVVARAHIDFFESLC